MATVKFYRGNSYEKYAAGLAEGKYLDGLFFDTVNHCIYLNDVKYGASEDPATDASKEWVDNKYGDAFIEADKIVQDDGSITISFACALDGSYTDSITIPVASFIEAGLMSVEDKNKLASIDLELIVLKEEGKGLSTNDFTNGLKDKLENIEAGAEVNAIESIKINGVTLNVTDGRVIDLDIKSLMEEYVTGEIASSYQYKGSVNNESELPTTGMQVGDIYNIIDASSYGAAGVNVAWDGNQWDSLGGVFNTEHIDHQIDVINSDINGIAQRVETIENYDLNNRVSNLEETARVLYDESEEDSINKISEAVALKVVNNAFAWEEIL